jgi:very-short-patch-repair endonuclease
MSFALPQTDMTHQPGLNSILQKAREELLDLSARNRLINTPRDPARGKKLDIVDERSEDVFRLLVRERKAMSFLPGKEDPPPESDDGPTPAALSQPEEEKPVEGAVDPRHGDLRLQTRLSSERLQTRLLDMYYDGQTYEQEQGISILYLAIGFLKWYESPTSDKARYAPLLLLPVDLERPSAKSRFRLRAREADIATNLSLQAKLESEFGVVLPEVPDLDELATSAYFEAVEQAIVDQSRWEVLPNDMVLWFFSFAKYLMYRDLDPGNWPAHASLENNPTLSALLQEGFPAEPPLVGDEDSIDPLIAPQQMIHVTDADSSQAVVIEEVRRGRSLVVQGPPGTGKSQTITNLIATAVKEGKTVLFVAEKMAALEVVYGRLERLGLGVICLELHSRKASKKAVLEEIGGTLKLGRPRVNGSTEQVEALGRIRDQLNRHASLLNTPLEPAGVTIFQIYGRLAGLNELVPETIDFELVDPCSWTGADFQARRQGLEDLQSHLKELGRPSEHPWWGVGRASHMLPNDLKQLVGQIDVAVASLETIGDAIRRLADALGIPVPDALSLRDVKRLTDLGLELVNAPAMDHRRLADPAWEGRRDEIVRIVERGQAVASGRSALAETISPIAWQTDLEAARRGIAAHGHSWFRWLRRDYREAVAALGGIMKGELPKGSVERLKIVDAVIETQSATRSLDDDPGIRQLGRDAFGADWMGAKSDWTRLDAIVKWDGACRTARLPEDYRLIKSRLDAPERCQEPLAVLARQMKPAFQQLNALFETVQLNRLEAFGIASLTPIPIDQLSARLRSWRENRGALSQWIGYRMRRSQLEALGLDAVVQRLHDGRIPADAVLDQFEIAYYEALLRDAFDRHQELREFAGLSHERRIEEFRKLDLARIERARSEVVAAHYDGIPRGSGGEMRIIQQEIAKKRRHKPIRQLLKESGTALQAIKPVFMMSPISVAQYLEPGGITFDLLLVDEASQVSPVDALGAMARARQVVVVGDSKQLPPTRFFSKMIDDDDALDDEAGTFNAANLDSILGLCVSRGLPERMLRWHYRSRHHSLIAVSNREFYGGHLYVVPSPTAMTAANGLHFRFVKDGVFDRGATRTNRVEAGEIARAVIDHARNSPRKSLGVGAFSVSQRDAIRDELELLLRQETGLDEFFAAGGPEPFFVKNLENIQGDERDVIFISVGYARDATGYMAMNFGPLSVDGGERRLNVLITRARERCEVFSSITADDIDLQGARSRGASAFKTFLRFAATGILDDPHADGRDPDSEFERQVAEALEGLGHAVHRRVGTSGFIIDLAVVDPGCPGRYLLGIACDGATYHSARSARDRDRLREAVLRDRGWKIHRIWSTDWFHRPDEQLRKLVEAIDEARLDAETGDEPEEEAVPSNAEPVDDAIDRMEPADESVNGSLPPWVLPYQEASFGVPSATAIPDTSINTLAKIVARVVTIEGPIHREELTRRVTSLWGQQRAGNRIIGAVSSAIALAIRKGILQADDDFLSDAQRTEIAVRSRSEVSSTSLRKPEMLPPAEIAAAIRRLLADHIGVHRQEMPAMVARLLGFKATTTKLKEAIDAVVAGLIERGQVSVRDEKLFSNKDGTPG